VKLGEIFGRSIKGSFRVLLLMGLGALTARAQERSWELSVQFASFNTYYQENFFDPNTSYPESVEGNSWDALQVHPSLTYRARKDLDLPFFVSVEAMVPTVTVARQEVGYQYTPGATYVTQKEQVAHRDLWERATFGWEMLPFLEPYLAVERSRFASERTGQVEGQEDGTFLPDPNADYTEPVFSTHLAFGVMGAIPLNANADVRLRYEAEYENPQAVFISNSYFGSGRWGDGTTGYTYGGRLQLDLPFRLFEFLEAGDGYVTIGGFASKRYWNGDGADGDLFVNGLPDITQWPKNFAVEAGGFIGFGVFF